MDKEHDDQAVAPEAGADAVDDATNMAEAEDLTSPETAAEETSTEGPSAEEAVPTEGKRKRALWKRPVIVIPVALLLVLTATLAVLAQPSEPEADVTPDPQSATLYFLLADAGIVDAVVDIQEQYVLVRYNIPEGADPETVLYLVLGTTYGAGPDVDQLVLQVYDDYRPVEQITVGMQELALFAEGHIDKETFESTWERR